MFKTILVLFCIATVSSSFKCDEDDTLLVIQKPLYDFSMEFLYRISYGVTDHFVYSPLSTWLQLITLAEGAQGNTLKEILEVTGLKGYRKRICYRRKFKQILNNVESDDVITKRSSAVIIDKFFKINKRFQNKVEALKNVNVLSLDFDDAENAAEVTNGLLDNNRDEAKPVPVVLPDDFRERVFLMSDLAYFRSAWQYPFNEAETKSVPFYSDFEVRVIGNVSMMTQEGYFKLIEIPLINAKILELPFADNRTSMILYLPMKGRILEIYRDLTQTTLTGIINALNKEQPKAVNVSLPKFVINTEVDNIPELLYDMGVKTAFYPDKAQLRGITDSGFINVSFMSQLAAIQVTESHVTAEVANNIINNHGSTLSEFIANKPFAFMVVDKKTEIILFAGLFSNPN